MKNRLLERYIKENIKLHFLVESSQNKITWGDVKKIIYKTFKKSDIKKFCNTLISTGTNIFMDIQLGTIAGAISDKVVNKVIKKINNSDVTFIFIKICKDTKAFGNVSSKLEKAISSLNSEAFKEVLENIIKEMKGVSDKTEIESIELKDLLNGFMKSLNLQIEY